MQLIRLGPIGAERPAVRAGDGTVYDVSSLTRDIDGAFLADDGITRVHDALTARTLPPLPDAATLRVGAPIARPQAVICIGQNYAAHAAESGSKPPAQPVIFFKHPNTVIGPYDEVMIPRGSHKTDWEVELAVVIGKRARYLDSPDEALSCVAGYTISNDVSERTFQRDDSGGQWSKGKCCETFNPLGPWLVPADEIPDPQNLRLRTFVNDEPRQDSTTKDMIFPVAYLIHHLSQFLVLEPGDIINTGTPQGVALSGRFPYLKPGDTMSLDITDLGTQRQHLTQA
jgi:2-keto-4-pentenoate hydratase/2-oxohepta-3-ene-1,7-dioic acid hydratase (catechol pathway)